MIAQLANTIGQIELITVVRNLDTALTAWVKVKPCVASCTYESITALSTVHLTRVTFVVTSQVIPVATCLTCRWSRPVQTTSYSSCTLARARKMIKNLAFCAYIVGTDCTVWISALRTHHRTRRQVKVLLTFCACTYVINSRQIRRLATWRCANLALVSCRVQSIPVVALCAVAYYVRDFLASFNVLNARNTHQIESVLQSDYSIISALRGSVLIPATNRTCNGVRALPADSCWRVQKERVCTLFALDKIVVFDTIQAPIRPSIRQIITPNA